MVVRKILNNNVITSNGEDGQEIIIVGNGIGWKQKAGEPVDESKIDKIFRMDTVSSTARLKQLFLQVRVESIQASSEIIEYALEYLGKDLKKNVYITLTDHIDFALERFEKGLNFQNALYWEIQKIYYKEFEVGKYALDVVEKHMGIRLPDDEAASIAMHLVSAEYDGNMAHTEAMMGIVKKALEIVQVFMGGKLDEETLDYHRFITHLLFFAQRVVEKKSLESKGDFLANVIREQYPGEVRCGRKICDYVQDKYGVEIGEEEVTFLAVHIVRVTAGRGDTGKI